MQCISGINFIRKNIFVKFGSGLSVSFNLSPHKIHQIIFPLTIFPTLLHVTVINENRLICYFSQKMMSITLCFHALQIRITNMLWLWRSGLGAGKLINIFEFIMMLMCYLCICPCRDLYGVILVIYYEDERSRKIKYENVSYQLKLRILNY